jgi:uncharacterized damage-inducible protein DinB
MTTALMDTLLAYDAWANRQLLAACRSLTQEQLERPLHMGLGSLADTLEHVIGSLFFFADRLNRLEPTARFDFQARRWTPEDLEPLLDRACHEFQKAVAQAQQRHTLADILSWTDTDVEAVDPLDQVTYAVAFVQMIDHGIHHRTQAMEMLRQLGVEAPLDWYPFAWDEAIRVAPR